MWVLTPLLSLISDLLIISKNFSKKDRQVFKEYFQILLGHVTRIKFFEAIFYLNNPEGQESLIILSLTLSEFKQINELLFPLKHQTYGFWMILGRIEVNEFAKIHLIYETKFWWQSTINCSKSTIKKSRHVMNAFAVMFFLLTSKQVLATDKISSKTLNKRFNSI